MLSEIPTETDELGVAAPVNVGWGKAETQFQGKAGKLSTQAPKAAAAEVPADDGKPRIKWRGDGEYFVTSTLGERGRRLRMWDREGVLQSTGEQIGGLEQGLAWRPQGSLIASTQRLPHRHDVIFYERNGLRHGEFSLPFGRREVQVVELGWNCDSTVLALWIESLDEAQQWSCLQLWCCTNYHWYCKQQYDFGQAQGFGLIADYSWDHEDARRFVVATTEGTIHDYQVGLAIDGTRGRTRTNPAMVGVIDGASVLLTPFRHNVVPPPMSTSVLKLLSPKTASGAAGAGGSADADAAAPVPAPSVLQVVFAPHGVTGQGSLTVLPLGGAPTSLAVLDSSSVLSLHTATNSDAPPVLVGSLSLMAALQPGSGAVPPPTAVRHLAWLRTDADQGMSTFLCVVAGVDDRADSVVELTVKHAPAPSTATTAAVADAAAPDDDLETVKVVSVVSTGLDGKVLRLEPDDGTCFVPTAAISLVTGEVFRYTAGVVHAALRLRPWVLETMATRTPQPCSKLAIVTMQSGTDGGGGGGLAEDEEDLSGLMMSDDSGDDGGDGGDGNGALAATDGGRSAANAARVAAAAANEVQVVVGCTRRGQLYLSGALLVPNCNSFAVHDTHLAFTTTAHTSHFINLEQTPSAAIAGFSAKETHLHDAALRAVERGAKIVAVVPRSAKVILQMPRGNLEVVWPRALILVAARTLLDTQQYRKAFTLLRKHRVNLNFMHDHNPSRFGEHVLDIVDALAKPSFINLLLADLRDEDFTISMYPRPGAATIPPSKLKTAAAVPGKRDKVCTMVRAAVQARQGEEGKYQMCVVQSLISMAVPQIDSALEYIREVRDTAAPFGGQDRADGLLKYSAVIVNNVNKLYDAALGTYDFDLVVMVAQVAQKDPKEYLPFLGELSELPTPLRNYRVDLHLKRYKKALSNLAEAGPDHFDACIDLTEKYRLHTHALSIFEPLADHRLKAVQALTAGYLCQKHDFREAGIMYIQAGDLEKALKAFEDGLCWEWCFSTLAMLEYDDAKVHAVAEAVVSRLEAAGRFAEASTVVLEYMDDPERAVVMQIQAQEWPRAAMLAMKHKRSDLMETHYTPALLEAHATFTEGFGEGEGLLGQFQKHAARIVVVRQEKLVRQEADAFGHDAGVEGDDLYSDTTSITGTRSRKSGSSRSTTSSKRSSGSKNSRMTHRSKRRQERKKTSLREGGAFEEAALLEALAKIMLQVEGSKTTVPKLVDGLCYIGKRAKAAEAEQLLATLLATFAEKYELIWTAEVLGMAITDAARVDGASLTANSRAEQFRAGGGFSDGIGGVDGGVGRGVFAGSTVSSITVDDVVVPVPPKPVTVPATVSRPEWRHRFVDFSMVQPQKESK